MNNIAHRLVIADALTTRDRCDFDCVAVIFVRPPALTGATHRVSLSFDFTLCVSRPLADSPAAL